MSSQTLARALDQLDVASVELYFCADEHAAVAGEQLSAALHEMAADLAGRYPWLGERVHWPGQCRRRASPPWPADRACAAAGQFGGAVSAQPGSRVLSWSCATSACRSLASVPARAILALPIRTSAPAHRQSSECGRARAGVYAPSYERWVAANPMERGKTVLIEQGY
jgi:hypothetical protein